MKHFSGRITVILDADGLLESPYKHHTSQGTPLLNLLASLKYDPSDPPLADLLRRYYKLKGHWIIVSPIRWEATHNDAQIVALGEELELEKSDFDAYAQYLAEEGKTLVFHNPYLWLLKVDKSPPLRAKPVHHLLGKPFMPELTQLDPSMFWQKFITESQMFFASKMKDKLVNGVWLWGSSLLTPKSTTVYADATWYPLVQEAQAQVTVYDASLTLKNHSVLLLQDLDSLSEAHKKELKQMHSTYYWNNIAYTEPRINYFLRLWRTIFHAD